MAPAPSFDADQDRRSPRISGDPAQFVRIPAKSTRQEARQRPLRPRAVSQHPPKPPRWSATPARPPAPKPVSTPRPRRRDRPRRRLRRRDRPRRLRRRAEDVERREPARTSPAPASCTCTTPQARSAPRLRPGPTSTPPPQRQHHPPRSTSTATETADPRGFQAIQPSSPRSPRNQRAVSHDSARFDLEPYPNTPRNRPAGGRPQHARQRPSRSAPLDLDAETAPAAVSAPRQLRNRDRRARL